MWPGTLDPTQTGAGQNQPLAVVPAGSAHASPGQGDGLALGGVMVLSVCHREYLGVYALFLAQRCLKEGGGR